MTGSPPSTSESVDSDVFDLSSSPLNNTTAKSVNQTQPKTAEGTTDGRTDDRLKGSTSSDVTEEEEEGSRRIRLKDTETALEEVDCDVSEEEVNGALNGGCLSIPGSGLIDASSSRLLASSPPSSWDSGVVIVDPESVVVVDPSSVLLANSTDAIDGDARVDHGNGERKNSSRTDVDSIS